MHSSNEIGPPADADQARWFSEQVFRHESSLKSYLRGSFRQVRDVEDVVQESYLRLWKARTREPVLSARAFLFKIARRVALDFLRKRSHSPIDAVGNLEELGVVTECNGVADTISLAEKVRLLAAGLAELPPRCRRIILLCKFEGKLRREAAAELGVSEKTVDEQLSRGVRRIEDYMRRHGVDGYHGL